MRKISILLVEDDELDVISVQRSLQKLDIDFELQTAYNGIEALALLREMNTQGSLPDIVLLDLNMPKMNGVEFLKVVRVDDTLKDLKVFVMTTSGEKYDRTITEKLGISDYLIKPLSFSGNFNRSDSMEAFVQFHIRKILMENVQD